MINDSYKLILNNITSMEGQPPFNKDFRQYKNFAHLFLNHKGRYLFAEDLLKYHREHVTLESVLEGEKHSLIPGPNMRKGEKLEATWYDILGQDEIEKDSEFFDFFFATKMRHLNLFEITDFLSFHLEYSFKNNRKEFIAFLNLSLNKYYESLLTPGIIELLKEWVKTIEANYEVSEGLNDTEKNEKIKGRIVREPGDRLTTLNLNQIALLIQLMQQTGVILKGDYLTYTQAGKAFNLLTGYSAHTIRQQLGTKGEIEGVKFEDYKELHETLLRMASLIEGKTRKK